MTYDEIAEWYDVYFSASEYVAEDLIYVHQFMTNWQAAIDDLGCGTGMLLERLPIASDKYVGVDLSASMLKIAQRKFPQHRFLQQDIAQHRPVGTYAVSLYGSLSYVHPTAVKKLLDQYQGYYVMLYADHYYPLTHKKWDLQTPYYKASEYRLQGEMYANEKYVIFKK